MVEIVSKTFYHVRFEYEGKKKSGKFTTVDAAINAVAWWMIHTKHEIAKPSALCTCRADELDTHCPVHNGSHEYYIKLHERLVRFISHQAALPTVKKLVTEVRK